MLSECSELCGSLGHQRRVERTRDRERHCAARTGLFTGFHRAGDGIGGAGDDQLTVTVVVDRKNNAVGLCADLFDNRIRQSQNRNYASVGLIRRGLHQLTALGDETQGVLRRQNAGGGERSVLTKGEAGAGIKGHTALLQGGEYREGAGENRDLAVDRAGEIFLRSGEAQIGDRLSGDIGGALKDAPSRCAFLINCLSHSGEL